MIKLRRYITLSLLAVFTLGLSGGCVYYNTFYNARKSFNEAEKVRKKSKSSRGGSGQYKKAIEKSLKVVENYPNSKYYDDALYLLGVSYYYSEQYPKAERRFREIIANYPESEYIKDVNLYLAKSKLMQNDMADAMQLFEEIFNSEYDRQLKVEAAMAIGTYHFDKKDYKLAEPYFLAVRDSLGDDAQVKTAQSYIADAYFNIYRFQDALGAYLQLLGLNPDKQEKYHVLANAATCSYRLQRIDDGMDYLQTLIDDELYYDSLEVLKLKLAEGYEFDDDLERAAVIYTEVAGNEAARKTSGEANYRLGLIYQYDYDDLKAAKDYYDKAVTVSRSSGVGKDALQKSSDIGKLTIYARSLEIDSTTTQEQIDEAAHTQYLLSELYWFQLNKPDTAMLEMQYLIDSFPTAYEVPKAIIALSQMYRDYLADTATADSVLNILLVDYVGSDYIPEALEILKLTGTEADTGYAELYIRRAEQFLDEKNIDSARSNYRYVVDNYPDSKYYLQARFAPIWLTEMYESPGDSSVIMAYSEFVDSFPGSYWADQARIRTNYRPQASVIEEATVAEPGTEAFDETRPGAEDRATQDSTTYVDPLEGMYIGPDGDSIINLPTGVMPTIIREQFEYPLEAYRETWPTWEFYFQILLDFSGRVVDYRLKNPTLNEELNRRVEETVASMTFDVGDIRLEEQENWHVYKYTVTNPGFMR